MSEKITLRMRDDPSVVLPEATLVKAMERGWTVNFGTAHTNSFYRKDWELVPPPYILPTKIGAVVSFERGYAVLADRDNRPWRVTTLGPAGPYSEWADPPNLLDLAPLTTLSEGVDIDGF